MSWNKNTSNVSQLDATINLLKKMGGSFSLSVLGQVKGRGLNDDYGQGKPLYEIRRLEYQNAKGEAWVMLEQMMRHPDCDCDDLLKSYEFKKGEDPQAWPLEEHLPDSD